MKKQTFLYAAIVLMGVMTLTGCEKDNEETRMVSDMTVAEYAVSDKNFSILVEALTKTGLVDALNGAGNFTVFAPTNDAFNKLFSELGVSGIKDLSAEALTPILLYHVIGEEKKSIMLASGYYNTLSTAQGNPVSLLVKADMSGVVINGESKVVVSDVDVKNGVIHAIDKVLLPPTVVDIALANGSFSILVQAVLKAGLAETLKGAGAFTIFAPSDAAFEALFAKLGVSGISDLSAEALTPILLYHVVSGNVRASQLSDGTVATLNGNISITLSPSPKINGTVSIIATDVQGTNGVVHVIDNVLLP